MSLREVLLLAVLSVFVGNVITLVLIYIWSLVFGRWDERQLIREAEKWKDHTLAKANALARDTWHDA